MLMRYQPFYFLCSIFYLLARSCCTPSSSEEKIDRPLKVVLIMADDLGYETIATPSHSARAATLN